MKSSYITLTLLSIDVDNKNQHIYDWIKDNVYYIYEDTEYDLNENIYSVDIYDNMMEDVEEIPEYITEFIKELEELSNTMYPDLSYMRFVQY